MALLRHSLAPLRAVRCLRQPRAVRPFSMTPRRMGGGGGDHHESQFDPPSGWLWGIKPGEKAEPEGWEWPMYLMIAGIVGTGIAIVYKPDTS